MTTPTVTSVFTDGITAFTPQLLAIAAAAVGVGFLILGLSRGWSLVKRFTK